MPIAKMSNMPNAFRYTVLCLDDYENKCMQGRIYHPVCEEGISFRSVMELLCEMESMFDQISYPKAAMETRKFQKIPKISLSLMEQVNRENLHRERRGKRGTFLVRICFRQNASWQGTVKWLEKGKELKFRSVMELLFMIDSALTKDAEWDVDRGDEETGL